MAQLSEDGLRIEGIQFPDPDPDGTIWGQGSTTRPYSVLASEIFALWEMKYDDATGNGTTALCVLIWARSMNGGNIVAKESYAELYDLWTQALAATPPVA